MDRLFQSVLGKAIDGYWSKVFAEPKTKRNVQDPARCGTSMRIDDVEMQSMVADAEALAIKLGDSRRAAWISSLSKEIDQQGRREMREIQESLDTELERIEQRRQELDVMEEAAITDARVKCQHCLTMTSSSVEHMLEEINTKSASDKSSKPGMLHRPEEIIDPQPRIVQSSSKQPSTDSAIGIPTRQRESRSNTSIAKAAYQTKKPDVKVPDPTFTFDLTSLPQASLATTSFETSDANIVSEAAKARKNLKLQRSSSDIQPPAPEVTKPTNRYSGESSIWCKAREISFNIAQPTPFCFPHAGEMKPCEATDKSVSDSVFSKASSTTWVLFKPKISFQSEESAAAPDTNNNQCTEIKANGEKPSKQDSPKHLNFDSKRSPSKMNPLAPDFRPPAGRSSAQLHAEDPNSLPSPKFDLFLKANMSTRFLQSIYSRTSPFKSSFAVY